MLTGAAADMHVSISHTGGVVAVALSYDCAVGVDVESLREIDAVAMARHWFAASEAEWVNSLSAEQRSRAFLWLWTCKEAIGKAHGVGLRGGGLRRLIPIGPDWAEPGAELRAVETGTSVATPVGTDMMVSVAARCAGGTVIVHRT